MKRVSAWKTIRNRGTAILVPVIMSAVLPACSLWAGKPDVGMIDKRLKPCPESPNCVCSEYPDSKAYLPPFDIGGSPQTAWEALHKSVVDAGGRVEAMRDEYLWATFTTAVLRFVDDVEFRLVADKGMIHVRSASRVGRYDFGVNRRRVERLREAFRSNLNETLSRENGSS